MILHGSCSNGVALNGVSRRVHHGMQWCFVLLASQLESLSLDSLCSASCTQPDTRICFSQVVEQMYTFCPVRNDRSPKQARLIFTLKSHFTHSEGDFFVASFVFCIGSGIHLPGWKPSVCEYSGSQFIFTIDVSGPVSTPSRS